MRRVWSSSGEQNSVKQTAACAVYLTSIQLDQQPVARANYRLSTPELLQQISWLLTRTLFVSKELRNNLEFNTNSDHAKILPNTKKLKITSFSESFQFQFQLN